MAQGLLQLPLLNSSHVAGNSSLSLDFSPSVLAGYVALSQ